MAARGWPMWCFDCEAAFLNGIEYLRDLYFRAPKEGLRGVPDGALLECVKGVFGLRESPRLWYLKFRGDLIEIGWSEVGFAKCFFILRDPMGELCGLLILHVDDGC
eukprot:7375101-Alexandrium_andersonii.AAC.1